MNLCAAVSDFQIQFAIHYSSSFPGARAETSAVRLSFYLNRQRFA